ncbi:hypothetical protein CASFOL_019352 [Castilleja foliolosa]|uniref:Maternal effect embryo arrest 22 n=1 Tax=Castilleja foliolosa TaxID=1961234 RepID=A0ABD3D4T3_9LAMI
MAQDVEVMAQEKNPNACCAALNKKHSKLLEKYSKLEELKNRFRNCTALVQEKYDVIEKENEYLKKALEELKVQVSTCQDEKDKECGRCVDLDDEVSALKEEIQSLKQNQNAASQETDKETQERLNAAEKEIKHLKELLGKEKEKTALEKQNAESEKKKSKDASKKVEAALKEEIQSLKQNQNAVSQETDKEIQERLNAAEKEIKHLKELLDKEKEKTALEKKNAKSEKKKAKEALKKVEAGNKKVAEAQNAATAEKKKADENRLLWEKLKTETDAVKSMLASERSKTEAADKKVEAEKQNAVRERRRADLAEAKSVEHRKLAEMNLKKAMLEKDNAEKNKTDENRVLWEKFKTENDTVKSMLASEKSKTEAAHKKVEAEKQKAVRERKRADLAEAKSEEHRKLAETNLKKAMLEKDRADDLNQKMDEDRIRFAKLEEFNKRLCSEKTTVEAQADKSRNGKHAESLKDAPLSKILSEKEIIICREKNRADSQKNKAKKQKKVAEEQKWLAVEQKHRADRLSNELESYKLMVKDLQKQLQEKFVSHRIYADNAPLRNNEVISEADTVKLLKKHLKLEKMLVKHANETAKVEALRNNMLHLELSRVKQEFSCFQQRLDLLDKSFLPGLEGTHQLKKIGNQTTTNVTLSSDEYHGLLVSGIDSGLDPSNQKMLQSCALNSSSASFSDRTLLGSQERRTSSVTTSDKLGEDVSNLKPTTISRLSDKTVGKSDNMRSRVEKRVGYSGKKRTLDAVEPNENPYPVRVLEKLSLLNGVMNEQNDEHRDMKEKSCRKLVLPPKRRKTSSEGMIGIDHSVARVVASSLGDVDIMKSGSRLKNGTDDKFDEMVAKDCMKLLDLDADSDESSYRRAIANPLSPLRLPELEIRGDDVDNPEMLAHKSSEEGPSNVKSAGSILASDALFNQIHVTGGNLGILNQHDSGNKETNTAMCERGHTSTNGSHQKYFIVPSDHKDDSSILRILQTMDSCTPLCSFLQSTEIFIRRVVHSLSKAKDLSMKEKACVFFSLVLHGISDVGIKNRTDFSNDRLVQSFDSVTHHIHSALSDPLLRRTFMESCDLLELFVVVEKFILQRKVFVSGKPEAIIHSLKANLVLNGNAIMVSEVVVSSQLLIAGGSLLASLCSAVDNVGFVCEMSCNIITMQKFDHAAMLAILHAFARVCGSKYFTLEHYAISMTVVKSLVMFLEKRTSLMVKHQSKSWCCGSNCPFLEGALSVEDVVSLLLENLRNLSRSKCWPQDFLVPRGETDDFSGSREASVQQTFACDEALCDFADVLSLVEIIASFMSWDWTFDHIISQLCEFLESHLMEGFSAAIIVLLGQLGRIGVGASGFEDVRVKKLRGRLSTILCETTFLKLDFSVQFAVITSLLGLTPINLEEIVEGKVETSAATSQSVPASFIREWFCQLSFEQQSNFRLHLAGNEVQ